MLGINKLLAFLRRSVGLRDDAASATGSLHAKLTDFRNYYTNARAPLIDYLDAAITTRAPHPSQLTTTFHTANSTSTTYLTVVDTTGNGYCSIVAISLGEAETGLKITIDGTVVGSDVIVCGAGQSASILLPFKNSVKVEVRRLSGTGTAACRCWVSK